MSTPRMLNGIVNNMPQPVGFALVRAGQPGERWTVPARSRLAFPGGPIAVPVAGSDRELEAGHCDLSSPDLGSRFSFWIAAAPEAFAGWTFGGFVTYDGTGVPWTGNSHFAGFPRTYRRLEPYPSGPTPPADAYVWITGEDDGGADLRVSILGGKVPG